MRKTLPYLFIILLLIPILFIFTIPAAAEENLLKNGSFEEVSDGWPANWRGDMWLNEPGVTYLSLAEGGPDGGLCAMVENVSANDARFTQTVTVKPGTVYRLRGLIKAEGCGRENGGANLSILDCFETFPDIHETNGEWVEMESFIRTDIGQKSLRVAARLGGYSADNTGKAWFDTLSLEKVDNPPEGVQVIQLTEYKPQPLTGQPRNNPSANQGPSYVTVILFLALAVCAYIVHRRGVTFGTGFPVISSRNLARKENEPTHAGHPLNRGGIPAPQVLFLVLLLLAAALRAYLMLTRPGYVTDINTFLAWSLRMAEVRPGGFYQPGLFCDYPPGYMYILWITGGLLKLFGFDSHYSPATEAAYRAVVKLLPVLADLATMGLLWRIAKKRIGETPALLLCALYAFNPAVLMNGAIWGQSDAVMSLGLVITVYFALEKKWIWALPAFTVTALMKPQALMAGPVGLAALLLDMRQAGLFQRLQGALPLETPAKGTKSLWKPFLRTSDGQRSKTGPSKDERKTDPSNEQEKRALLLDAAKGVGLSILLAVVLLAPFVWDKENPLSFVISLYQSAMGGYQHATINTANLYYLLGANWTPLENQLGPLSFGAWGTLFMVGTVAFAIFLFFIRSDRENLPFFLALTYIGIYLLGVMMHERYLYPALVLLLYAYIRKKDWRYLALFIGFSITIYINCALVLLNTHLPMGVGFWAGVLSALNLTLGGFAVWTAAGKKTRPLPAPDREATKALQSRVKESRLQSFSAKRTPGFIKSLRRADYLAMAVLTVVYGFVGFSKLGVNIAPQTLWMSTAPGEEVIFDLGESKEFEIMYYPGINQRDQIVTVEFSEDGQNWHGVAEPVDEYFTYDPDGMEFSYERQGFSDEAEFGYDSQDSLHSAEAGHDQNTMDNEKFKSSPAHAKVEIGQCFSWRYITEARYNENGEPTDWTGTPIVGLGRYTRLIVYAPSLSLMEVVFRDMDGNPIPVAGVTSAGYHEERRYDPALLADESETMPEYPTYMTGTYFDEIYHARTGYEHAHQMTTYEWTHPPLGKVFIMLGIKIFGMTPFGWRFMGALAGLLMVPAMYLIGKLLFKKTKFAALAAFVMAFDMMHLTQTRIATIDSYAVLFIILMYLCMFRYLQMSFFRDGWRTLLPLGLSGLFFGLGCASKWICIYSGAGLAVLFAWSMVSRHLEWKAARESEETLLRERAAAESGEALLKGKDAAGPEEALLNGTIAAESDALITGTVMAESEETLVQERIAKYFRYLTGTLAFCVGFFIVIPFAIYYLSYIPHFAWQGGVTLDLFLQEQVKIFRYHSTLVDDHAFKSPWYEWPLILKPMYYYNGTAYAGEGNVATIMCMGNPAVWWIGLCTFLYMAWRWLKPRLRLQHSADARPAMLLIAFASQFVPWMLVPRSMFIYHYFGGLPFVMLSIVYAFERIDIVKPALSRGLQIGYMAVVLVLFVGFYPFATGVPFPRAWADAMNWLSYLRLPVWAHHRWLLY